MLKVIADRDVRSLGSQREGKEGKDMGVPMKASGEEKAQPIGSLQLALAPSSNDTWESMYRGLDIFSSPRLMGCSCGNGMVKEGL